MKSCRIVCLCRRRYNAEFLDIAARQTYSGEGSVTGNAKPVKQIGFGSSFTPKSRPTTSNLRPSSRGSISKGSQTGERSSSQDGSRAKNILHIRHSEGNLSQDEVSGGWQATEHPANAPLTAAAARLKPEDKMRRR